MKKTELEMAKNEKLPDFNLKLGYKILPLAERNAFEFMFGVNLPFVPWSIGKYDNAIKKNEVTIKSSSEEYDAKQNEIRKQITEIVNNMNALKETMNFYHNVQMPQTENTLKSAQYSYETGGSNFLDLLDSYRMYRDAEIMYFESVNMYLKMLAELEKATGMNLKN